MLTRLTIQNFQSLKNVELDLGKFTVIVGPSSSGKTALVRALRVLVSNSRGTPYVTHGQKTAKIGAELVDAAHASVLEIERGGSVGTYRLSRDGSEVETFTKLGGAVPEAVARLLGIGDGQLAPDLCVAGQFDRPYLLDETGSKVAQVLGELTNVSVIFDAGREANRLRLSTNSTLKIRESDFAILLQKLQEFKDLPARIAALNEIENSVQVAQETEAKIKRLESLTNAFEVSKAALDNLHTINVIVPDFVPIETANSRMNRFQTLIRSVSSYSKLASDALIAEEGARVEIEMLEEAVHSTLVEAGECPLCGANTKEEKAA